MNRSSLQITSAILEITKDAGQVGIGTTSILSKANIPHGRFKTLISNLTRSGLVNKIEYDGKNTFVITEKGKLYLESYKRFQSITDSFGLEL